MRAVNQAAYLAIPRDGSTLNLIVKIFDVIHVHVHGLAAKLEPSILVLWESLCEGLGRQWLLNGAWIVCE